MPSITVWKCSGGSANSRTIGCKRERDRMLRRPVERARDLLPPPRELRARDGGIRHLVDDVVDLAAERVERGDRAAARRRQEQEAVVEARAALRGLLLAVLVGCHAAAIRAGTSAWYATAHQSRARSTGRRANTSPSTASMRSRMRRPPAITADSSSPRRHGSARASGRPAASSARARAVSNASSARQRSSARLRGDLRLGRRRSARGLPAARRRGPSASRSRRPARSWSAAVPCRRRRSRARLAGASAPYSASRIRPTGLAERRQ